MPDILKRLKEIVEPPATVTVQDGKIVTINHSAEVLFGYFARQLDGQPIELLIPSRFHDAHIHHRESYINENPTIRRMGERMNILARNRWGAEFPALVSLAPAPVEDGVVVVATVVPVTDSD